MSYDGVLASSYEDDVHDPDYVALIALQTGTAGTDLLVDNNVTLTGGTSGPSCPDNFMFKIDFIVLTNTTGSAIKAQIQKLIGAGTPIVILSVEVPSNSSVILNAANSKLLCQKGYRFQAISSAATSLDVTAYGRLTEGAGL